MDQREKVKIAVYLRDADKNQWQQDILTSLMTYPELDIVFPKQKKEVACDLALFLIANKPQLKEEPRLGIWYFDFQDEKSSRAIFNGRYQTRYVHLICRIQGKEIVLVKAKVKQQLFCFSSNMRHLRNHTYKWPKWAIGHYIVERTSSYNNCPHYFPHKPQIRYHGVVVKFLEFLSYLKTLILSECTQETWAVAVARIPKREEFLSNLIKGKLPKVQWLNQKGEFLADPFLIQEGNSHKVLAETIDKGEEVGRLTSICLKSNERESLLNLPTHLSYPFVWKKKEKIFCVPESSESGKLIAYPIGKSLGSGEVLIDKPIVDPTIYFYNNRWWLFATRADDFPLENLYIWYQNEKGDWVEHDLNPVKRDITSARPAGNIFEFEGKLIRPAQNSEKSYGGSLKLMQINILTPHEFQEEMLTHIKPLKETKYKDGIHTLNFNEKFMVIDGKKLSFSLKLTWQWLRGRLLRF